MRLRRRALALVRLLISLGRRWGFSFTAKVGADHPAAARLAQLWAIGAPGGFAEPLGSAGYTLPELGRYTVGKIAGGSGDNWLILAEGAPAKIFTRFTVDPGASGNLVIVGKGSRLPLAIHLQAKDGVVVLAGENPWTVDLSVRLSSDRNLLFLGKGATSNGTSAILEGEGIRVLIGEDCMFARDTVIRPSDLHGICEIEGGRWLNPPADIVIEPHVWIGEDVTIMKGVRVGIGSIIGAKALVSKSIPRFALALGLPAKVARTGVTWQRPRRPDPAALPALQALAANIPEQ